jgi:hypothetical protein
MPELSAAGSTIVRQVTPLSVHGFESELSEGWKFLTSADMNHHRVYANEQELKILSFCEGDVIIKQAPDMQAFYRECLFENEFALNG